MAAALRASEACSLSTAAAPTSSESTHELSLWHLSCLHTCTATGQNNLKLHHFSFLQVLLIGQTGNNQSSLSEVCRAIRITCFHFQVRNWCVFLTLNRNTMLDANPSATYSHSSSSDRAVMGGAVNAAWWWSALREGAGVDHLCCLCDASSIHRLKGGVRRQMLNDSLKATALALISSPVCAGCHSNWPEHLSNAAYIGLLATRRIYRAHIPIKGWRHVWLMWL